MYIHTKIIHDLFWLKGGTNLACLLLLLFPDAVQECVQMFYSYRD